jgi:LEA14-like dessication related protein
MPIVIDVMRKAFALVPLLFVSFSCKSPPIQNPPLQSPPETPAQAVPGPPAFALRFDRIEAASTDRVSLFYLLEPENAGAAALPGMRLEILAWEFLLNGEDPSAKLPKGKAAALESMPGEAGALSLRLDLDLPEDGGDFDEYWSELRLRLIPAKGPGPAADGDAATVFKLAAAASFPRIRAPEFTITSIAVMRAELINTRFQVDLRIDNPNIFPVSLSSLGYELYGTGRFWADGKVKTSLEVPPRGSAETRLSLVMNFINMRRELLNEVIALGQVPYRFTGEALVDTGIPMLPSFRMDFDHSGYSAVIE